MTEHEVHERVGSIAAAAGAAAEAGGGGATTLRVWGAGAGAWLTESVLRWGRNGWMDGKPQKGNYIMATALSIPYVQLLSTIHILRAPPTPRTTAKALSSGTDTMLGRAVAWATNV